MVQNSDIPSVGNENRVDRMESTQRSNKITSGSEKSIDGTASTSTPQSKMNSSQNVEIASCEIGVENQDFNLNVEGNIRPGEHSTESIKNEKKKEDEISAVELYQPVVSTIPDGSNVLLTSEPQQVFKDSNTKKTAEQQTAALVAAQKNGNEGIKYNFNSWGPYRTSQDSYRQEGVTR